MDNLETLLTTKHQLKLLVQVLDEWILPNHQLIEFEKQQLTTASQILGEVYTQLEFRLMDVIKNGR